MKQVFMDALVCRICKGELFVDPDGVTRCKYCRTPHVVESDQANTYAELSEAAYKADNLQEAEIYASKALELSPKHVKAWYLKGCAAGWQTNVDNNRFKEAVNCYKKALLSVPEKDWEELGLDIMQQLADLGASIIVMHDNFLKEVTKDFLYNAKPHIEKFRHDEDEMQAALVQLSEETQLNIAPILDAWTEIYKSLNAG